MRVRLLLWPEGCGDQWGPPALKGAGGCSTRGLRCPLPAVYCFKYAYSLQMGIYRPRAAELWARKAQALTPPQTHCFTLQGALSPL